MPTILVPDERKSHTIVRASRSGVQFVGKKLWGRYLPSRRPGPKSPHGTYLKEMSFQFCRRRRINIIITDMTNESFKPQRAAC